MINARNASASVHILFVYLFWSKVNIWNVNCARTTAFIFDTRTGESVKVFETENVSTWGGLEPSTFGFMPNALAYWAIRARHFLSHVIEHWLWQYRYFEVKLTFEMLTVRGQQHSFSTHERVFLWKCQRFWDRKCLDLRETRIWGYQLLNKLKFDHIRTNTPELWI